MKWYGILAFVFSICFLGLIGYVTDFNYIETKWLKINNYDCAKEFDKFATKNIREDWWYGDLFYLSYNDNIITDKEVFHFLDNRCYTTYKSWKTDSSFEYFILENAIFFEHFSYQEQMFNHDIDCTGEYQNICKAKEGSKIFVKSFDRHCKSIDESSPQLDKDACWKGVMTDLEKIKDS